jgi:hypothetical protein
MQGLTSKKLDNKIIKLYLAIIIILILSPITVNAGANDSSEKTTLEPKSSETVKADDFDKSDKRKEITFTLDTSKIKKYDIKSDISISLTSTDSLYNFDVTLSADNDFTLKTKRIPAIEYKVNKIFFESTNKDIIEKYKVYYVSDNINFESDNNEMKIMIENYEAITDADKNTKIPNPEYENIIGNKDINDKSDKLELLLELENEITNSENIEQNSVPENTGTNDGGKVNTANNTNKNALKSNKKLAGGILITLTLIISILGFLVYKIKKTINN